MDDGFANTKLLAILEKPQQGGRFWLIDVENATVKDFSASSFSQDFARGSVLILVDGKDFYQKNNLLPDPHHQIICLRTLKRLLENGRNDDLHVPQFKSFEQAHVWVRDRTNKAMNKLTDLGQTMLAKLECRVVLATLAMEKKGLPFNKAKWASKLVHFEEENKRLRKLLEGALKRRGEGFLLFGQEQVDVNHPHEVKAALEELLGRKLPGTSYSALKDIHHPTVKALLAFRENARMLNTYGPSFLAKIREERLHGNFVPIGCSSGRFACHDTNLLALPHHPLFQACLRPKAPRKLLHLDYGGFELRILAALSNDQTLLEIFNENHDIHCMVAESLFHTKVSKKENVHLRDIAKTLNFGIIYGMGVRALAKQLKVAESEAEKLLENYFKRFSRVLPYLKSLENQAHKLGYGQTALGRRADFSLHQGGNLVSLARNMPIQGTGADIIKLALCRVYQKLYRDINNAHVVNLVHDEIVIECDEQDIDFVSGLAKKEMEAAFTAILPNVFPEISIKHESGH